MKNLVLTIVIGNDYRKIANLTHPFIKKYAAKIGADFICIDKQKISKTTPHWEKFQIYDLLNKYDRILYIDSDIIIRNDCPDLFKIVPENKLGAFNEAPYTNRSKELMIDICKQYGVVLPDWNGKYYNSGVLVLSKQHKYLFKKPNREIFSFYEQSYLNMKIALEKPVIHELYYKFNRMTCMDKFTGEERFASFIIHYAGYPNLDFVLNLIPKDIGKWEKDKRNYNYKRHIFISVNGGLGDQVNAEPAIRFLKGYVYPNDDVRVATHYPRLFQHLDLPVYEHGKSDLLDDTPYYLISSLPGPETPTWMVVSNLLCHTVDYCSIALLRRTLPVKDKQVILQVNQEDINNLKETSGINDFSNLVVIHAGRHWQSKTFPVSYWQGIIDKLDEKGLKVCLVGKDEMGDAPDYKIGARGTVDVKCPKNGIDLRNLLDLGSLMAILKLSPILVSNDSAPIHIAGAFSNWIILIPSCKHSDHVLPIRNGRIDYKTKALYKKLALDDINQQPTSVEGSSGEFIVKDWNEYLPNIDSVVNEIKKIYDDKIS